MNLTKFLPFTVLMAIFLTGCVTDSRKELFRVDTSQVQLRSFQTRAFDTKDRDKTLKTIIATMQDLGFVITRADADVGIVTGSKLAGNNSALLTVTVRDKNEKQIMVRANAQQKLKAVESPEMYQDFFVALERAMFLKAQEVD
jgi:hypothetical protein